MAIVIHDYTVTVQDISGGHRLIATRGSEAQTIDIMSKSGGGTGGSGADGFSPIIEVTEISGGHRLTVTDANGTESFDVLDGAAGATGPAGSDGFSPIVNVTEVSDGYRIDITDAEGTESIALHHGKDGESGDSGATLHGTPDQIPAFDAEGNLTAQALVLRTDNLFNIDELIRNKKYDTTTGALVDAEGVSCTPLIPFESTLPRMKATQKAHTIIAFNANKAVIQVSDIPNYYYSYGMNGAAYVAFVFTDALTDYSTLMIKYVNETSGGTQNTIGNLPYEPYYKFNEDTIVGKTFGDVQRKLEEMEPAESRKTDGVVIDYARFVTLAKAAGCTVQTDANGNTTVAVSTGSSGGTQFMDNVECKPYDVITAEFMAQSSEPEGTSSTNTGAMIIVFFYDKDERLVGDKYNFSLLGVKRPGYHRYSMVAPKGTTSFECRVHLRTNTSVLFSDFRLSISPNVPQRERAGILYDQHLGGNIMLFPENTMEAFEAAKRLGATCLVSNMNMTSDKVIVCLHDDTLDRTSDGSGAVSNYTYEQLLQYDFGSWLNKSYTGTKIPKLEEFIRFCAVSGIRPIIRMSNKFETATYDDLIPVIHGWICKYGLRGMAGIKSENYAIIDKCREVMGDDVEYILYAGNFSDTFINYAKAFDGDITLETQDATVTDSGITAALAAGLKLSAFTVNEPATMRQLILKGVTRFCTDAGADMVFPLEET